MWQGKKSLCPTASAIPFDSIRNSREKIFMWHINCPKLSSYKHNTQTHTQSYTTQIHVLVSVIYIQLASLKDEQTFIKTLLCYVLYIFDFSALTSPFSQDIPIYIINIYNNVSFLETFLPSAHPNTFGL